MRCPKCGSANIEMKGKKVWFFGGLFIAVVSFFVGLMFPQLWAGFVTGIVLMLITPFMRPVAQCKNCRKIWTPQKENGRT